MKKEIHICRIFLQESTIETPEAIDLFQKQNYQIDTDLSCQSECGSTTYEKEEAHTVSLSFQIVSRTEDTALYVLNFTQTGLFRLTGYEEDEIQEVLAVDCPNIIMPYARLHANQITSQTGLSPVLIQDLNFKELYYNEIGKELT